MGPLAVGYIEENGLVDAGIEIDNNVDSCHKNLGCDENNDYGTCEQGSMHHHMQNLPIHSRYSPWRWVN